MQRENFFWRPEGAVIAEGKGELVCLYTSIPLKGPEGRALRRHFPQARRVAGVTRLGYWPSLVDAAYRIGEVRAMSASPLLASLAIVRPFTPK